MATKVIATTMSDVREQAKMMEEDIHSTIEHLIAAVTAMLRDREAALINDVETTKHEMDKELQLRKDGLEFVLSGIRHAVLFSAVLVSKAIKDLAVEVTGPSNVKVFTTYFPVFHLLHLVIFPFDYLCRPPLKRRVNKERCPCHSLLLKLVSTKCL